VVLAPKQRLFPLKRMKNHVNNEQLKKVANSIWTSKARYGLQLHVVVRRRESKKTASDLTVLQVAENTAPDLAALQVAVNNLLRTPETARIKEVLKKCLRTKT
jgi:hypothetical protein